MRRCWFSLVLGLVVSGCGGEPWTNPTVATPGTADSDKALSAAVASVDRVMAQLHPEVEATRQPEAGYVPAELRRPFDVNLANIAIDQAARALSDAVGYKLDVINPDKRQPPAITLNGTNVPLIDLFRALGAQGGTQIEVLVNADMKTVQVLYRKDRPHA